MRAHLSALVEYNTEVIHSLLDELKSLDLNQSKEVLQVRANFCMLYLEQYKQFESYNPTTSPPHSSFSLKEITLLQRLQIANAYVSVAIGTLVIVKCTHTATQEEIKKALEKVKEMSKNALSELIHY